MLEGLKWKVTKYEHATFSELEMADDKQLGGLEEPPLAFLGLREQKILKDLNKTLQDFYQEATYQLNKDLEIYMAYVDYGMDGEKFYKRKLLLGGNTIHTPQVINRMRDRF